MNNFNVTFERTNPEESEAGETYRRGFLETGISLRDAIRAIRNETSAQSETRYTEPGAWPTTDASWFGVVVYEWKTGDDVMLCVHFPATATPASRARLCRLLGRVL